MMAVVTYSQLKALCGMKSTFGARVILANRLVDGEVVLLVEDEDSGRRWDMTQMGNCKSVPPRP